MLTEWYAINMQLSYFIVDVISFLIQDAKDTTNKTAYVDVGHE